MKDMTVVSCIVLTPDARPANFSLQIYGIPIKHFYSVPGGGNEVNEAFKLEGLGEGYQSSPFFVEKVPESYLRPERYRSKPKPEKVNPSFLYDMVIPPKRQDMRRKKTKEEVKQELAKLREMF